MQDNNVLELGTPISDFASVTHTHFDVSGAVTAIGEQPIKGILNPGAMARLTVIEMLNNIIWGNITNLEDIKCSGNWMWPLKMEGENINYGRLVNQWLNL